MADLFSYFVKNSKNLVSDPSMVISGNTYRFTVLTPRLIRLEYNKNGTFENRATSLVINRAFSKFNFTREEDERMLKIITDYFTLTYVKDKSFSSSSLVCKLNNSDKEWYYGHPEVRNMGAISYSLEDIDTKNFKLNKGLCSSDGFVALDDSSNLIIDNGNLVARESGVIDIYLFMYKNDLGLAMDDYFLLTGKPELIPRYALGSWWYKNDNYNMYDIDNVIRKFRENDIPISVFMLGDKWHDNNCNYSFNRNNYDLNVLGKYFSDKKINFGVTINPTLGIKMEDPLFEDANKYIASSSDKVSFLPVSNQTMAVYINLVVRNINKYGINLFNIDCGDMKDKNILWSLAHIHYCDSALSRRGLVMSLNHGVAIHRYPIIFTGKTKVSWSLLSVLPSYNYSISNIGGCFIANAIGGYYGGVENSELFIRYIQFGVFSPIFILSSDGGKYYKREPWKWNYLNLSVIRKYMQFRNKLIPYIYNEAYKYYKYGSSILKPLYYKYPKIYDESDYKNEYFFGSSFLICPITKKKNTVMNRVVKRIFLPSGIWYEYDSGKKFIGNKYYTNFYKDEEYPVFVSAGSIIPLSLDDGCEVPSNMEIEIFSPENGLSSSFELYEDDGISYRYRDKVYSILKFFLDKVDDGYSFSIEKKEGVYRLPNRNYKLRFRNMNNPMNVIVYVNGTKVDSSFEIDNNDLVVNVNNIFDGAKVRVHIIGDNLEIETFSKIYEEIADILEDLEIETVLKMKIDKAIFNDLPIKKKRILLRKLKRDKLEPKYINMFIGLLEFMEEKK